MVENFTTYFFLSFALIFVIEGLLYALFPSQIQQLMARAVTMNKDKFRSFGAMMLAFGVLLIWLLEKV